jgi:L-ascorbate metabolism protein UlaG (beta-lactamase superfamily)
MAALPQATFLGHSTLRLDVGGIRVLTDPVLRSRIGPLSRQGPDLAPESYSGTDVVVISHLHHDHLDIGSLRRLGARPRIVVPRGGGSLLARAGFSDVVEIAPGERLDLGGVHVTATEANHRGERTPVGPWAPALGYIVDDGRRRLYFAGDTDLFAGMADLEAIDVAFLPVGGWGPTLGTGHLDPTRAARAARMTGARLVVPIHWGTFWPRGLTRFRPHLLTGPAAAFERAARELAPGVVVSPSVPGDEVELETVR